MRSVAVILVLLGACSADTSPIPGLLEQPEAPAGDGATGAPGRDSGAADQVRGLLGGGTVDGAAEQLLEAGADAGELPAAVPDDGGIDGAGDGVAGAPADAAELDPEPGTMCEPCTQVAQWSLAPNGARDRLQDPGSGCASDHVCWFLGPADGAVCLLLSAAADEGCGPLRGRSVQLNEQSPPIGACAPVAGCPAWLAEEGF